jgi:glutathione S-transferase
MIPALTLWYVPRTRASRPRWLLEELGVPYDLARVDVLGKQHHTPDYQRIHPLGHVPALRDGDVTMFESAAIVLHLADRFPEAQLAPAPATPDRARYYQWIVFAMTELEPPLIKWNALTAPQREDEHAQPVRRAFASAAKAVEDALGTQKWILGDRFSAADVMLIGTLLWARGLGLLAGHPVLEAYVARGRERPAWARATAD